jgi:hypothetical protein
MGMINEVLNQKGDNMKRGWLVTFSGMGLNLARLVFVEVFGKQLTEAVDKGD